MQYKLFDSTRSVGRHTKKTRLKSVKTIKNNIVKHKRECACYEYDASLCYVKRYTDVTSQVAYVPKIVDDISQKRYEVMFKILT